MLVRTNVVLVKARHHGGTRRGTNGRRRECKVVTNSFGRKLIHMRRLQSGRPVARQVRRPIFDRNPQNAWFSGRVAALCRFLSGIQIGDEHQADYIQQKVRHHGGSKFADS